MKISFYTPDSNLGSNNGYGYAGRNMRDSLIRLGHEMPFNDPAANVQMSFSQPDLYSFYQGQYTIGYTPWESSALPEGWLAGFNSVDELWTTSDKCLEWFENAGVTTPVRVFEHGVEKEWESRKRYQSDVVKFLHVGEPAPRKGGQMALEAFRAAFGNRTDVHLTIKAHGFNTVRAYESSFRRTRVRSILGPIEDVYKNVTLIDRDLPLERMVRLFHDYDALVYPSWGEGFGLIPLQALATGMPTICTGEWSPYRRFLGELDLDSKVASSPWPEMHPGNMYQPDFDHLVELYRYTYENIGRLSEDFHIQSDRVHKEYNWDSLTEKAFKHLENK